MATVTDVMSALTLRGDGHDSRCGILRALDKLKQCNRFESSRFSANDLELLYHQRRSCVARLTMRTSDGDLTIAIKNIRPDNQSEYSNFDQTHDPDNIIKNELMIWNALANHPNVASFLGITNLNGSIRCDELSSGERPDSMAVSKYYPEGSLHGFSSIASRPADLRLGLLISAIRGLEYIHSLSIVHGDLKAANLLFKRNGKSRVKVTDFGSSVVVCQQECPHQHISQGGSGTLPWDSPELYRRQNPQPRSYSSDIWAFGCLALEVQMGLFPYTGRESGDLFLASRLMRKGRLPAIESEVFSIIQNEPASQAVWDLIQECWQKNYEDRPSASDLRRWLERIQPDCVGGPGGTGWGVKMDS
ncbi:unnamed protein product [Rhizoctonia solani]|uniref:Protein kinase domain-containing protein n=1 Tax=Rhizoctonia solani TaxID=456999 RepID=A0A8H3D4T7_9AGAM|nr:unnamed protein product [Rhizoctonia solani]